MDSSTRDSILTYVQRNEKLKKVVDQWLDSNEHLEKLTQVKIDSNQLVQIWKKILDNVLAEDYLFFCLEKIRNIQLNL